MIRDILKRAEESKERETEEKEEVVLETTEAEEVETTEAGPVLTKEVEIIEAGPVLTAELLREEEGFWPLLAGEEAFGTEVLGPNIYLHEYSESDDDDIFPLVLERQKLNANKQPLLALSTILDQPCSPSMSPGYSPPPWTPTSAVYCSEGDDKKRSPLPLPQISRSPPLQK